MWRHTLMGSAPSALWRGGQMPIGRSEEFHYLCLGALDETFVTFAAGRWVQVRPEYSEFDPLSHLLLITREHL